MVTFASMRHWLPIYSVVTDGCARSDCAFVADLDVFSQNSALTDGYVLSDLGRCRDCCLAMNGAIGFGVAEEFRGSGEGQAGLIGNQERLGDFASGEFFRDDGSGWRDERGFEMIGVLDENEAIALCGLQAGDAGHRDGAISKEMAVQFLGEIAEGSLHGCLLSLYGADVYNADSDCGRRLRALARHGRGRAPSPHESALC